MLRTLSNPTLLLTIGLMGMITMMILPAPPILLDFGLALSFALSIMIFATVLFASRPADFTSFPSVLLAALMLRLALNISSTRLIIGEGHTGPGAAGDVIRSFSQFIMGGDLFIGMLIFLVILIVNFIVITKGAGRMAEVSARFALDGIPGRQMAIDSDLAAGIITPEQATQRRRSEQIETSFYGSLDGASKFVKGDAIAGLLITALNFIVGIAVGTLVHRLPLQESLQTYSLLTVGDGLVSQVPSVIVSIAAALLLAKGTEDERLDRALQRQMINNRMALAAVACILATFSILPGLPFIPFAVMAATCASVAYFTPQAVARDEKGELVAKSEAGDSKDKPGFDDMAFDKLKIEFATDLVGVIKSPSFDLGQKIAQIRKYFIKELGFLLPEIRLADNPTLPSGHYAIFLRGVKIASGQILPGKCLAIPSTTQALSIPNAVDVREPVFQAAAKWIDRAQEVAASRQGASVVSDVEVITTHLVECCKNNMSELIDRQNIFQLLEIWSENCSEASREHRRRLVSEQVPTLVPYDTLQVVLQDLLTEGISVRDLGTIIEAISTTNSANYADIIRSVRRKLRLEIAQRYANEQGSIEVVSLSKNTEAQLKSCMDQADSQDEKMQAVLNSSVFRQIKSDIAEKEEKQNVVLLSSNQVSRAVGQVLRRVNRLVSVIDVEEVHPSFQLRVWSEV